MSEIILDVRERDEYEAEHVANSINVPLSHFSTIAPGVLDQLREKNVMILCRGGNRAKLAAAQIAQMGYSDKISIAVYEGGILKWKEEGKPTVARKAGHLPIMRQVQLVAGLAVFTATLLGAFVHPGFLGVSVFFGAGLAFAGATGFCGMAELLARMPWNKNGAEVAKELCEVSPKSTSCCK